MCVPDCFLRICYGADPRFTFLLYSSKHSPQARSGYASTETEIAVYGFGRELKKLVELPVESGFISFKFVDQTIGIKK
jgi:hypothetical protein